MKNIFLLLIFLAHTTFAEDLPSNTQESQMVQFTPPAGWHYSDSERNLKNVRVMVIGKGNDAFPPSINLAVIPYKGSLKSYLKNVKMINDAHGDTWKDLGKIMTEAGQASLSQLDTKQVWGDVRMMHVILVRENHAYVLTAAALREEFPLFYKDFFKAMRSLKFTKDTL